MSELYDSAVAQVPASATVTAWDEDSPGSVPGPTAVLTIELDGETFWVEFTTVGGTVAVWHTAVLLDSSGLLPFVPTWKSS